MKVILILLALLLSFTFIACSQPGEFNITYEVKEAGNKYVIYQVETYEDGSKVELTSKKFTYEEMIEQVKKDIETFQSAEDQLAKNKEELLTNIENGKKNLDRMNLQLDAFQTKRSMARELLVKFE